MKRLHAREEGQAVVEMAIILLALFALTAGLIDVGRSIFAYNEVGAVARYGSRWASVVGGTCASPLGVSSNDWCNQLGNYSDSTNFWTEQGNAPIQGAGTSCPSYASTPADWYEVSKYAGTTSTTIVGAIAHHFDTTSQSSNVVDGSFAPGINLGLLRVCIALSGSSPPATGDSVTVDVYYPFQPAGGLITNATIPLSANAQWEVE